MFPEAPFLITFSIDSTLGFETYQSQQLDKSVHVTAGDTTGLMYAALDLAEQIASISSWGQLTRLQGSPYIPRRGLKFNIPLDARTPSYDDTGDAAQKNIQTVWDFNFWRFFLDQMAINRYNLLTLWSLHPYPSMIQVPEYPDVALEDVCVYTQEIDEHTHMKWKGEGIQNPANLKVVKTMSMAEKITYWRKVFAYAKSRGIDIYLFHWNVFVYGAEGKYGIEWRQDDPETIAYIRKCVSTFLLTYPDVKGIGVTAGEHVNRQLTDTNRIESWMWQTYGLGIEDARAQNPDLDVTFIFRRHWSDWEAIQAAFKAYPTPIETSFKYARARMLSSTNPPWFDSIYQATIAKHHIKCWLNLRNDDLFTFRWGDPEYARAFLKQIPVASVPGFYMGPDGYVWGRDFTSTSPSLTGRYAWDKHWYRFMIWGRLAYNIDLPEQYFVNRIQDHFPEIDAPQMYEGWKASSKVISWVNKIHFRQNDAQWLPAGCFDKRRFHTLDDFLAIGSMPVQGIMSIGAYVQDSSLTIGLTPWQVADSLDWAANQLLKAAQPFHPSATGELAETLGDFYALAYLASYYADKIRAATALGQYRKKGILSHKQQASHSAQAAIHHWDQYTQKAAELYYPQLMARTQRLDWVSLRDSARLDLAIVRSAYPGQTNPPIQDNRLWRREKRRF